MTTNNTETLRNLTRAGDVEKLSGLLRHLVDEEALNWVKNESVIAVLTSHGRHAAEVMELFFNRGALTNERHPMPLMHLAVLHGERSPTPDRSAGTAWGGRKLPSRSRRNAFTHVRHVPETGKDRCFGKNGRRPGCRNVPGRKRLYAPGDGGRYIFNPGLHAV